MWNNIFMQILLLLLIFALIHAIYVKQNEPFKIRKMKHKVSFNVKEPYEPVISDSFLYNDSEQPNFPESRANEANDEEYPDNCNDQRTIGEIHDEFLERDITREMDMGNIDGIYKNMQYEFDKVDEFGYTDFATY